MLVSRTPGLKEPGTYSLPGIHTVSTEKPSGHLK